LGHYLRSKLLHPLMRAVIVVLNGGQNHGSSCCEISDLSTSWRQHNMCLPALRMTE
jgi:hypothetical protein